MLPFNSGPFWGFTRRLRDPHNYLTEVSSVAIDIRVGRRDILFLRSTFRFARLSEIKRLRGKVITELSVFLSVLPVSLILTTRFRALLETGSDVQMHYGERGIILRTISSSPLCLSFNRRKGRSRGMRLGIESLWHRAGFFTRTRAHIGDEIIDRQ